MNITVTHAGAYYHDRVAMVRTSLPLCITDVPYYNYRCYTAHYMQGNEKAPGLVPQPHESLTKRKVRAFWESPPGERVSSSALVHILKTGRFRIWMDAHSRTLVGILIAVTLLYGIVSIFSMVSTYLKFKDAVFLDPSAVAVQSKPHDPRVEFLTALEQPEYNLAGVSTDEEPDPNTMYQMEGFVHSYDHANGILMVYFEKKGQLFEFLVTPETIWIHDGDPRDRQTPFTEQAPVVVVSNAIAVTHPLSESATLLKVETINSKTNTNMPLEVGTY